MCKIKNEYKLLKVVTKKVHNAVIEEGGGVKPRARLRGSYVTGGGATQGDDADSLRGEGRPQLPGEALPVTSQSLP
jgi:hypothetical protein